MTGRPALKICLLLGAAISAVGCTRQINQFECRSGNPDARIAGCTALIQAGQDTGENLTVIYHNRATAYHQKRDYDRAILDYNDAIRLDAKDAASYLGRGISYYDKKDYDHAIQDFEELNSLDPYNTVPYLYYGLAPKKASAWYYLGNAYSSRGYAYGNKADFNHAIQDYNEAIQDYSKAIQLSPGYAFAWEGRGLVYDRRGIEHDDKDDYDRSIQDYDEAIRLSPNHANNYTYRGLAYDHSGDYDRAIQDLNQAIRLDPKDTVAYIGRAAAYTRKSEYGRAVQDLDETIRLNPKDAVAYWARGNTYLFQSNLAAATSDFESAISAGPSSRMAVSAALMLHVSMKRQGHDDSHQLQQVAAAADLSKWPGPVLKLDMGKMTPGEVMATADADGDRRKWHVCQANYFIGEDALIHNQRSTALARLKAARDGCPKWDASYVAALADLNRLSATPASSK